MNVPQDDSWPKYIQDRDGRIINLTSERWEHALGHPGMAEWLLESILETLRTGGRRQDRFDPSKFKYTRAFSHLPGLYTHVEVVIKFGWHHDTGESNNFVLTAYLIEKW